MLKKSASADKKVEVQAKVEANIKDGRSSLNLDLSLGLPCLLASLGEITRRTKSACIAERHVHSGIVDHA
jgi:hypothetical protein